MKKAKRFLKSFLLLFIRIDKIPFTEDGQQKEFCILYLFDKIVASKKYDAQEERDELCEYLGII